MALNITKPNISLPNINLSKPKYKKALAIGIDSDSSNIYFASDRPGERNSFSVEKVAVKGKLFTPEFFSSFSRAVENYAQKNTQIQDSSVILVVPNRLVATDIINIPTMNRKKNAETLDVTLETLYRNKSELHIHSELLSQSKHLSTYSIISMRQDVVATLKEACSKVKVVPAMLTFASATSLNACGEFHSRMKNASYLLLDIKANSSVFTLADKGRVVGFYPLPFGYTIMDKNRIVAEDMLFDHPVAELAVVNAREKARAKQLATMRDEQDITDALKMADEIPDDEEEDTANLGITYDAEGTVKTLPKKQARHLPKSMMRPVPEDPSEFAYENFRIFVKWALNLIMSNEKAFASGTPETVYVNMPDEFADVISRTNDEKEENGVTFATLDTKGEKDNTTRNLELYGALYPSDLHSTYVF